MISRTRRYASRRARGAARSRTIPVKRLTREELRVGALLYPPVEGVNRPRTRGECRDEPRPCPFVSCRFHLYLDVNPETGSIKIVFPDLEPWELAHTCALDVADGGGLTLEEVGEITNLTRERVRQLETRGLIVLRQYAAAHGIEREDAYFPHADGNQTSKPSSAREESAKRARAAYVERKRAAKEATRGEG